MINHFRDMMEYVHQRYINARLEKIVRKHNDDEAVYLLLGAALNRGGGLHIMKIMGRIYQENVKQNKMLEEIADAHADEDEEY